MGRITKIQRFSISDGPGIRTTVFFKGCSLRCRWCANPETQAVSAEIVYHAERCAANCGACVDVCRPGALRLDGRRVVEVDGDRDDAHRVGPRRHALEPGRRTIATNFLAMSLVSGSIRTKEHLEVAEAMRKSCQASRLSSSLPSPCMRKSFTSMAASEKGVRIRSRSFNQLDVRQKVRFVDFTPCGLPAGLFEKPQEGKPLFVLEFLLNQLRSVTAGQ